MAARILIIDHQLHRLEFLEAVLLKAGFAVAATTTGADALAACTAVAPVYDLLLLDMQMPSGESLATYQALRALPPTQAVPILLLTQAPAAYWEQLAFEESPPVVMTGQLIDHAVVVQRVQWMLSANRGPQRPSPDPSFVYVPGCC
jgi:CheY-like chemotaxis protein